MAQDFPLANGSRQGTGVPAILLKALHMFATGKILRQDKPQIVNVYMEHLKQELIL